MSILAKGKRPLPKRQNVKAGAEVTSFGGQAGLADPDRRAVRDAIKGASLLTRKFVKVSQMDVNGKDVTFWEITAIGHKQVS